MSASNASLISLEQAKELVQLLEDGEVDKANQIIHDTSSPESSELFAEVGKLTRVLHDSLRNFQLDARISNLANDDLPDAKERLNYVMNLTEQAANRTMDAVESSLPIADKINNDIAQLKPHWNKLMSRDLKVGEFKALCRNLDNFIKQAETDAAQLHVLLTEVLMAQDFQDLTGQVIRRIIELVREVEDSLIYLLKVFAGEDAALAQADDKSKDKLSQSDKEKAEGPIMNAEVREDVVTDQDEVDDLLSSLGF
ncbi:protein phosphatase CheZ [Flocculibacter collagenilyticus]|uniref:protein phosphatase CheZ n=1 Tax=Flocculibacter collagenilyticus TaxID=2744479 RepID=UPI0018F55A4E|nr:protein phosphatase CheZ [Flocculibacter collagenilyticus]